MLNHAISRALALLYLLRLALASMLLVFAVGAAHAAVTINTITVNGGSSTNVPPGSNITVVVNVTITAGSRWRSTTITTTPGSTVAGCTFFPDINFNGTYNVTFNIIAPSPAGTYALNIQPWANPTCNGTQWPSRSLAGAINNGVATLNHVRLQHDGIGQTCTPKTITLRACADAECLNPFLPAVSVTMGISAGTNATYSANPVSIVNGTATVLLSKPNIGKVSITGSVTSPAPVQAARCYRNGTTGTATACEIDFQLAECSLEAVEPAAPLSTRNIFTRRVGAPIELDVLTTDRGAINTSSTSTVTAVLVDASSGTCTGASVSNSLTKNYTPANAGRQRFQFTPTAAARIVKVKMNTAANVIQCSTDNFAIRPDSFTVTAVGAGADPTGMSGIALPAIKAFAPSTLLPAPQSDMVFTLRAATATGYNLAPRLNGNRVAAANVADAIAATGTDPAVAAVAGTVGEVTGNFGAATVPAGSSTAIATGNAFAYSEAGYVKLLPFAVYDNGDFANIDVIANDCLTSAVLTGTDPVPDPNVPVGGKIGCHFGSSLETAFLGRFTPSHFVIDPVAGPPATPSLTNRSAITTCTSSFTYMGEPLTANFSLEAQNSAGSITQNYAGKFVRLNATTQSNPGAVNGPDTAAPTVSTVFQVCSATIGHPCFTQGTASAKFEGGTGEIKLPLTVLRDPKVASGPFNNFTVSIAPVDSDSVTMLGAPAPVGTTSIRWGRMNVNNTYGSELLNMGVKVSAQYWKNDNPNVPNDPNAAKRYVTSTDDNCSALTPALFTLTGHKEGITTTNLPASNLVVGSVMVAGASRILLKKPVPPTTPPPFKKGSAVVNSISEYLPGSGRATFGVYKTGPIIYVRETY